MLKNDLGKAKLRQKSYLKIASKNHIQKSHPKIASKNIILESAAYCFFYFRRGKGILSLKEEDWGSCT
jgi:hypothetical protein